MAETIRLQSYATCGAGFSIAYLAVA